MDRALNQHNSEPHTEIMLWLSPGYKKVPQLNFYKFDIYPGPENIRVIYKIENLADRSFDIQNEIDLAIVSADAAIGDPGRMLWCWSKARGERKTKTTSLAPGELFKEEINIDRKEAKAESQYYINAYYKGELVSQYKIIEGLYK